MITPPPFSPVTPEPGKGAPATQPSTLWLEEVLTTAALLPTAFAGAMFRHLVGGYFKVFFDSEVNYCILYANVVGCIVMGFVVQHSSALKASPRRTHRVLYTALTTGLCGSITTWSSWMYECNKNFLLQWEGARSASAANGGRLFEWLVTLWVGVATPLMAYRLGTHLAALSPYANARMSIAPAGDERPGEEGRRGEAWGTAGILLGAAGATALVVALPVVRYPASTYLTYTAVLGFAGAYTRWKLAVALNAVAPRFPLGTFIANTLGTWLLAVFVVLSKFVVAYYDVTAQGLLYAAIAGFCGCLTTVSTFVHELDGLPVDASYMYGLGTTAAAQTGLILIYNVYAYLNVPKSATVAPVPVHACVATQQLCHQLLDAIRCPLSSRTTSLCDASAPFTAVGACGCGDAGFATDTVPVLLSRTLVRPNFTNTFVYVWPTHAAAVADPVAVFDYCLTFERVCSNVLDRVGCPTALRVSNGCNQHGILHAANVCGCGGWTAMGDHLPTLLVDAALTARPPGGVVGAAPVLPLCPTYRRLCQRTLDLVNCPDDAATVPDCASTSTSTTSVINGTAAAAVGWAWPRCGCGPSLDLTGPVRDTLLTALARPTAAPLLAADAAGYCTGFARTCAAILAAVGCPAAATHVHVCGVAVDGPPTAAAAAAMLNGASAARANISSTACTCLAPPSTSSSTSGVPTVPAALVSALVVSALLDPALTANFSAAPPPFSSPYIALVRSNPFMQFIA